MNLTFLLTIIVIVLVIYIYRNLRVSNYFFSVFFDWVTVYKLFEIKEEEYKTFNVGDDYKKLTSNNVNYGSYSLMHDKGVACFEYYVMPKAVKGQYSWSHIYDQQNKTFFESPNTMYKEVLKSGGKNRENASAISCGFEKGAINTVTPNRKSCFWITYRKEIPDSVSEYKTLVIIFNEEYLNIRNAQSFNDKILFDVYLIEHQDSEKNHFEAIPKVKKIEVKEGDFSVNIHVQSQQDAETNPLTLPLYRYFKEQKVKK
jgi:hypothetical protein